MTHPPFLSSGNTVLEDTSGPRQQQGEGCRGEGGGKEGKQATVCRVKEGQEREDTEAQDDALE
ncbi:hypothetical protein E2C01_076113 [Portunus trituberculatus]|uniref:Uncharacterized protein n=1 Tax=Portunus trituberculatus TaxID=210409 RepID=A0A5B7IMT6_PORTR|nr:hypothetical protein [Portunus trituberculatus]